MELKPKRTHAALVIYGLLLAGLAGCAAFPRADAGLSTPVCERGRSICTMNGPLSIAHPWEAKVDVAAGCIAMLVPDSFSSVAEKFNGKRARVTGQMFPQPTGEDIPYYIVRGMRANANTCLAAMVLFSIEGEDGSHWEIDSAE